MSSHQEYIVFPLLPCHSSPLQIAGSVLGILSPLEINGLVIHLYNIRGLFCTTWSGAFMNGSLDCRYYEVVWLVQGDFVLFTEN